MTQLFTSLLQLLLDLQDLQAESEAMKRGRTAVLLTLFSSVAAVKVHDAMALKAVPAKSAKMEFGGPGSPAEEAKLSELFQRLDLDSSGELDLNEVGIGSFGEEEWQGPHKVELEKQIQTLLEQLDEDGSGTLNLDEYEKRVSNEKQAKAIKLIQQEGELRMLKMAQDHNLTIKVEEPEAEEHEDPDISDDHPASHAMVLGSLNQSVEKVVTTQRASSFVSFAARRKTNKKQKKWASKEMAKMEKTICKRFQRSHHQAGKPRSWRPHSMKIEWFSVEIHCDGWNDLGPLGCFRPCIDEHGHEYRHGVGAFCYKGCPSGYLDGNLGWCAERCGADRDLPFVPKECDGWLYCATDTGVCNRRAVEITMSFAGAIVGLIPYVGKPAQGIARAVRVGTKAAIKKALKAAMKQISRKLIKKAKKNLRKYVKKRGKEMVKETAEAILEGGAEELASSAIEEAYPNLKQEMEDLAAAVDPTGIADIVQSFAAEDCSGIKVQAMPEDGVVDEVRLAETGVMHYVNSCSFCGVNLCDHSLRQGTGDEAIENFQLGDDTNTWGCSKFQNSEYSVVASGYNLRDVYLIEEDGVAASSHKYAFTSEGQCQSGYLWGGWSWNLEHCKIFCNNRWNCKHFSFFRSPNPNNLNRMWCSLHSSCTHFDSDPAYSFQKGGVLWSHLGEGWCGSYTRIQSGWSSGAEDCKNKCEARSDCKYFSYWSTSKWCISWKTCTTSAASLKPHEKPVDTYQRM